MIEGMFSDFNRTGFALYSDPRVGIQKPPPHISREGHLVLDLRVQSFYKRLLVASMASFSFGYVVGQSQLEQW